MGTRISKNIIIKYGILFLFFLMLGSLFPYSGDDWAWGSSIGIDRLNNLFRDYNGRYLGNAVVLLLTRSNLLKTFVMSLTLTGIIYLSQKIINNRNNTLFLIAILLILAVPRLILRQSIVWTSGFSNYTTSTFLILIYIYLTKNTFQKQIEGNRFANINIVLLFLLGIATTLFVEHITVYSILLSSFIIIYSYIKFKRVQKFNVAYLCGAVVGAIIMFSNGAYYNVLTHADGYRSVPSGDISGLPYKIIDTYLNIIYKELIFNNIIINISISILLTILMYKHFNKKRSNNLPIFLGLMIILGYVIYSLLVIMNPGWEILLKHTQVFEGIITALYFITIILMTFFGVKGQIIRDKMLLYLLSIIFVTAPLFFVNPIGSRCFFITYVLFVLYILELYNYMYGDVSDDKFKIYFSNILFIAILCVATYLVSIYLYIAKINNERIIYMYQQLECNNGSIKIPILPYENYLWMGTPQNNTFWEERYKLFYHIDSDVDIIPMELEKWRMFQNNNL